MTRTDIELTTDLGIRVDGRGDLATVTGDDAVVQRGVLRALNVGIPWRGERLTRENALDLRDIIIAELQNDSVVDRDVSGRVVRTGESTVELSFTIGDQSTLVEIPQ